jgi:riboflavin biosynthesis pyrimidine reductase
LGLSTAAASTAPRSRVFAFAKAGLVDEWYITITPRLIGGRNAPSFLDGEGFLKRDHIELKLVSEKRVGDELFLRYRKKR